MKKQGRDKKGRFGRKSDSDRKVRSIRVTDDVWEKLGEMAHSQGITRADLVEEFTAKSGVIHGKIEILEEALKLKANAGGAIKRNIRKYLNGLS